jgi:uncharacterized OB-fold protein
MTTTDGNISMNECSACAMRWQPPLPGCPRCGETMIRPVDSATTGSIYSWVSVVQDFGNPKFPEPHDVIAVDLDAGGRILARYQGTAGPRPGGRVWSPSAAPREDGDYVFIDLPS